jgi:hypothetical protein
MSFFRYRRTFNFLVLGVLVLSTLISLTLFNLNSPAKVSQASFKCPDGFTYVLGNPENKNSPLPHNCTKSDDMVLVCENDYIPNTNKTPLHPKECIRDLVVFPCSVPLKETEYVIHKSLTKLQYNDPGGLFVDYKINTPAEKVTFLLQSLDTKISEQQVLVNKLKVYSKPIQTSSSSSSTSNTTQSISEYDKLTEKEKESALASIKLNQEVLDKLIKEKNEVLGIQATASETTLDQILQNPDLVSKTTFGFMSIIKSFNYAKYGDLCTKSEFKDSFHIGNVCNRNGGFGKATVETLLPGGAFLPPSISRTNIGGIPTPDKNGLVSYFNELAYKVDSKDYGKFKEDLFDLLNNDSSRFSNQLCLAPTKALRANVTIESRGNGCIFGIDCQTFTKITEAISDVADTCDIIAQTCRSLLKCIRSIHKCEPQNVTYPISEFNYYIGKENKNGNGQEISNGRAVQFEPDYENLPKDRTFLPNQATNGICPNSNEWRPFYVGTKTDFHLYDTTLLEDKPLFTPFTCVKKGFDLRSEIVMLRDNDNPSCGARTEIYGDTAASDDSALIICTPPLDSDIKVLVCPGGTSIKRIGDYTNIDGNKCYKSIAAEDYIVDETVVQNGTCKPAELKPDIKATCTFNLSKANFAGYNSFDSVTDFTSIKKYPSKFILPEQGIKVKIQEGETTNIAISDNCSIPFVENSITKDGVVTTVKEYSNTLVCENIDISSNLTAGTKKLILNIGDFNYPKGTIEAKLGGCSNGQVDIYDCFKCLSGQNYVPSSACFQPGNSVATASNPISGSPGSTAPNIPIANETLPNNTLATFTPAGTTTPIKGKIQNGGFVPDPEQLLPTDTKEGPAIGILEVNGKKIEIPTNFTATETTQVLGSAEQKPLAAKIGDSLPNIPLKNNTLPNGTIATFTPAGASTSITGTIQNNQFVADPGQTIPVGSTPGVSVGILKVNGASTGVVINLQSTPELIKNVPFTRTGGFDPNQKIEVGKHTK